MKRRMTGGTHRGPLGAVRQRRTLRLMQVLFVAIGVGLIAFAAWSWTADAGIDRIVVAALLGLVAMAAAAVMQGPEGVRMPTPARLDELAGRAEGAAIEHAEAGASPSVEEERAAES